MTILVDMDDVLEKLVEGWVEYINAKYGTDTRLEDVRDWNVSLAFPTLTHEQVYSVNEDDDFWDHVRPMPGAREGLEELLRQGHEVIIVTATDYRTLRAKMDRVLFRYFPFIKWDDVIITPRKQLVMGDILIDDGPHNMVGGRYRKILYDRPHNRDFDEKSVGAVRVYGWTEVLAEVEKIGKEIGKK